MRLHRKTLTIWWLSYMTLVVLSLAAMWMFYLHTADTMQQALERTGRERAEHFADMVDLQLQETRAAVNSLQSASHMQELDAHAADRRDPDTLETIRILQKDMRSILAIQSNVDSLFIWLPQSQMLLTDMANWRGDNCTVGMKAEGVTQAALDEAAAAAGYDGFLATESGDLLYLRRVGRKSSCAVIGAILPAEALVPEHSGFLDEDILLLYLNRGTYRYHASDSALDDLPALAAARPGPALTLYPSGGTPLAGVRGVFTRDGYEVVWLAAREAFLKPLSSLRLICIIASAALLLLGGAAAWVLSRVQYQPIRRVADLVLSRAQSGTDADAFSVIERSVNEYLSELNQMENQLEASRRRDREHALYRLISGAGTEYTPAALAELGVTLSEENYVIVCVNDTPRAAADEETVAWRAATGTILDRLNPLGRCLLLPLPSEAVFLLDALPVVPEQLLQVLQELAQTLQATLQVSVRMGVSRPQPGLPGIQLAAQEAEAALNGAARQGVPVLSYRELTRRTRPDHLFFSRLSALYDLIGSGSYQAALDLVEELSVQAGSTSIGAIVLAINSAAFSVRLETPAQEAALRAVVELPATLHSPADLQEYAGRVLGQLAVSTAPERSEQEELVLAHMQRVFCDPQMSVAELARQLNLSQSTLARITARTVGLTPLDYLQKLQMDRAKELLQSGMTVATAAEQVGCTNAAALRRIFKKFENATPAAFTAR